MRQCQTELRPDGTVCGQGRVCELGECVCPAGLCVVTVTPGHPNGWDIVKESEVAFVTGPDSPPRGTGSVRVSTFDVPLSGLANQDSDGLPIGQIETLGYATFMANGGESGDAVPAIKLPILFDNGSLNLEVTTLVFEPKHSENSEVVAGQWQPWNALGDDARWWSTDAFPLANPENCGPNCLFTWQEVHAAVPDAAIIGGLRIETGSDSAGADGYVDVLAIRREGADGTTVYDFEPDPE